MAQRVKQVTVIIEAEDGSVATLSVHLGDLSPDKNGHPYTVTTTPTLAAQVARYARMRRRSDQRPWGWPFEACRWPRR